MTESKVASQPQDERQLARRARWEALRVLWRESEHPRVSSCRRWARDGQGGVGVKVTGAGDAKRAGFSGLVTCGSVWACPVCSASIAAQRATEVEDALVAFKKLHPDGTVVMATFTMRHNKGHGLMELWEALSKSWHSVINSTAYRGSMRKKRGWIDGEKQTFAMVGYIRVVEATIGANGWHIHTHVLFLSALQLTNEQLHDFHGRLYGRWVNALANHGLSASREHGVDVKAVAGAGPLGQYFTKAVYELTGANLKGQRSGNVTPFGLLARLVVDGDAADLDLWREWEAVSAGRRQLLWSHQLREVLGLVGEITDEEIVERDELAGEVQAVLYVETFVQLRDAGQLARVLDAAERSAYKLHQLLDDLFPNGWGPARSCEPAPPPYSGPPA